MLTLFQPTITFVIYSFRLLMCLTHLSRINFPISIGRTSLFQILGVFGGIFHFYSNSNRTFCEQTVETLIRLHAVRRLISVCAVCLCPTKRRLGLYGLISLYYKQCGPRSDQAAPKQSDQGSYGLLP